MADKLAFAERFSTISIVGTQPPGKISVPMNLMNSTSSSVIGKPRSIICCSVKAVMVVFHA
jgi:hypothetical protein